MTYDDPMYSDEELGREGLSREDVQDYLAAQERLFERREELREWCRNQARDPKFRVRIRESTFELHGSAAITWASLQKIYLESGVYDPNSFLKAILVAGAGVLWEQHRESLLHQRFVNEITKNDPKLLARIARVCTLKGARLHKQLQREAFNDMMADFRLNQDRKDV